MKKKSLAIIEINTHAEVLQNFLNILGNLSFDINLYVIEKVWKRIKLNPNLQNYPTVYVIKDAFQVNRFFKQNLENINHNNIIFINTLETHFKLFSKLKFTVPVICRVHNSNTFFNPSGNLYFKFDINYIIKDITYILKRQIINLDIIYRPRFIKSQVDYFCFPDQTTTDFALENNYVSEKNIIPPIPLVYRDNKVVKQSTDPDSTVISIIGGINKRRRNYKEVYKAFVKLVPELNQNVELYLLGKPIGRYGRKIVKSFKNLENKYFKVYTYNKFVPFEEFSRVLSLSNFQIIPVKKYAKYKIFKEFYGKTKISGNVNDMILYELPALLPDYYPLDKNLERITLDYKNSLDLKNQIFATIQSKKLNTIDFDEALLYYRFNIVKARINEIFRPLL